MVENGENVRRLRYIFFRSAPSNRNLQLIETLEPSTGQVLGAAANSSMKNMQTAIQSAHTAQQGYITSTTAAARGTLLQKWHDLVMANIDNCTPLSPCLGTTLLLNQASINPSLPRKRQNPR
jgi:hypothetical protein